MLLSPFANRGTGCHDTLMRLRQIEIFYHVYQEGSITGAARALHVSQPSVSKVLRYAEDQLGFLLFKREKGRLYPTPAADELFGDIKDIYQRIAAFDRSAQNIRNRKGGHIRLGVLPSLSLDIVPECIAEMRKSQPELSFEISTLHSHEIKVAILENRCDLCLGYGAITDDRLDIRQLAEGQLMLVANDERPIDSEGAVSLPVLHERPFVDLKDSGPLAEILAHELEEQAICPETIVTAQTYYVALSLVRKGLGVTVTDQFTACSQLCTGLKRYPFSPPLGFSIISVVQKGHPQGKLIEAFIDVASDFIQSQI
ncbi:LysR family transcriptional regulator [Parasphingorhabdus sp.]|uniref:LysR family transcriptional regulator n=1 Tax=Parasphingorhabdus sp. TaxID=2709688 RepID=UPI003A8E30DE